jgi:tRNA-guanine family transglycosylase
MPVGTNAAVRRDPDDLHEVGASLILANAYHLALRPGMSGSRDWAACQFMSGTAILTVGRVPIGPAAEARR